MRRLLSLTGLAGLLGLTLLIAHQGVDGMAHALARGGAALFLLLPLHALPLLLDAQGWRALLRRADPAGHATLGFLWWVAGVREAVNRLLPTASIGGELVGIRLARWRLRDGTAIAASIVVEVMVTLFAQYLFAALGVLALLATMAAGGHGGVILAGLLLSLPVPVLFALSLRHSDLFARLEGLARRVFGASHRLAALVDGARLDGQIRLLLRRRVLLTVLGWQFSAMAAGTVEVWFALARLGHPVTFWQALAIEALTQTARQITFFVPAGLGVQEAVVLLLGNLLGVSPLIALSLALVKRARELMFGVPALLSWQWLEWRRWRLGGAPPLRGAPGASGEAP